VGRRTIIFVAVAAALAVTRIAPPLAAAVETTVVGGKLVYLVLPGDTLGGIAKKFLGSEGRWRELWKANPQIVRPNLIFPGDAVVVGDAPPPPLEARPVEAPVVVAEAPAQVIAPEEFMERQGIPAEPVDLLEPRVAGESPQISARLYLRAGFISSELPEARITGSRDGRLALSTMDQVTINRGDRDGVTAGQEFRILHPLREVFHPETGASLGWIVRVVGRLKASCFAEHEATAIITAAYDPIRVGDRIDDSPVTVPSDRSIAPKLSGPCLPSSRGLAGTILASEDDRTIFSEGDLVFIDRGLSSGVVPGSKIAVYRQEAGQGRNFLVGELQVLMSQNFTATALVTNSIESLRVSDRLMIW
jgi:hypothetical protein